jgi:hypothetical protein
MEWIVPPKLLTINSDYSIQGLIQLWERARVRAVATSSRYSTFFSDGPIEGRIIGGYGPDDIRPEHES